MLKYDSADIFIIKYIDKIQILTTIIIFNILLLHPFIIQFISIIHHI
jgi:hypothetical protein